MPTYQVICAQCGEDRWPTLPARPEAYVCARCMAVGPGVVANRKERAREGYRTRLRSSKRLTEPLGDPEATP